MRASFHLLFSGQNTEVKAAFEQLHELLVQRGFFSDEDFELICHGRKGALIRFNTVSALQAAISLLPSLDVFTVITNPELNY